MSEGSCNSVYEPLLLYTYLSEQRAAAALQVPARLVAEDAAGVFA
jgi:hypothetical protein